MWIGYDGLGTERGVARAEQHPHEVREALLGADGGAHLRVGVELHTEAAPVEIGDREAELRDAAARRVPVVARVLDRLGELLHRDVGRRDVGVAEPEVDDVLAGSPGLDLQRVHDAEHVRRKGVDPAELHRLHGTRRVSGRRVAFAGGAPSPCGRNPFRDSGTPEYSVLTAAVRRLLDAVVDALDARCADAHRRGARARRRVSATLETACGELPGDQQSGRLDGQRAPMPVWNYTQDDVDGFRASGQFSNGHTGPPGTVHGGWVAFAFDEVLAWSIVHAGYPGMTGRLTIRYRKPTPVGVPVEFRVEPPRVAGKVVHVHGTLTAGDAITAEAEGLFVHFKGRSDAGALRSGRRTAIPRGQPRRRGSTCSPRMLAFSGFDESIGPTTSRSAPASA